MSDLPKIYLAIDNCFASKRWTRPAEWMEIIRDSEVRYVETSADTECDPLYHGRQYLKRWSDEVGEACEKYGCTVANLYSGHGTYATLGLAHTDASVRDRFLTEWMMPMVDTADALHAGFGFFAHAFPQSTINDEERFHAALDDLYERLATLAEYARSKEHVKPIGVEQMYAPHQVPWTIPQAHDLLADVFARKGAPFYLTLDVGHAGGQRRYLRSTRGSDVAAAQDHLFADERDSDPYAWLRELAGWSPIVHLQQTDGKSSPHWPFTPEFNERGIITAPKVLHSIYEHFRSAWGNGSMGPASEDEVTSGPARPDPARPDPAWPMQVQPKPVRPMPPEPMPAQPMQEQPMPPRVNRIYLTIEAFAGTAEYPEDIIRKVRRSVEYWRRHVPEDGLPIDQLVQSVESSSG